MHSCLKNTRKSDIGVYKMGLRQTPDKSFVKMYSNRSEKCEINIRNKCRPRRDAHVFVVMKTYLSRLYRHNGT